MRIQKLPAELRGPSYPYPAHNTGLGVEEFCHLFLERFGAGINSERIYLPIYWMNNYYYQGIVTQKSGFQSVKAVQQFLDHELDPAAQYVTIVQSANGTYEHLPDNVIVLGTSGVGDVPLPLVCQAHPRRGCIRNLTASFVGAVKCGGPKYPPGTKSYSTSTPDAIGALIRRQMMEVFSSYPGEFYLEERTGWAQEPDNKKEATEIFRDAMYHSKYALAPRGYGKTSFRLYEAMQLGCVPVYIYDEPWLPYEDVLDWREFCILCPHDELPGLPERLRTIPEKWRDGACRLLYSLVQDYFSLEGITKQLTRIIEGLDA